MGQTNELAASSLIVRQAASHNPNGCPTIHDRLLLDSCLHCIEKSSIVRILLPLGD